MTDSSILIGSGSGRGGSAQAGQLLRQAGETDKGIFYSPKGGDISWHLQAERRDRDQEAVAAALTFLNQDQDASLAVTLPLDWVASPELVNTREVIYTKLPLPQTAAKAELDYGALNIKAAVARAIGNSYQVRVVRGRAAVSDTNAHTDVDLWAGNPGLLRREFRVTAPNAVDPAVRASALYRFGSRNNGAVLFRNQWHEASADGNGFQINFQVYRDNDGSEQTVATYAADNRSMTVVITGTAARRNEYPWAEAIAAINAARTTGNDQLIVADAPGGSVNSTNFINIPSTDGQTQSMSDAGNALPNRITLANGQALGTVASNAGAATNRGGVRVITGDGSRAAAGAKTTINVAPPGDTPVNIEIVYTGTSVGAAGNSRVANVGFDSSIPANTLSITGDHTSGDIDMDFGPGTVSLGSIITALTGELPRSGGGNSGFFISARITSNADSVLNVTWGSTDSDHHTANFSGGHDAGREPLSAVWDSQEHRLTITALATDTASTVFDEIVKLDQFNSMTAGPGFIQLRGAADATNVIAVDSTIGDHIDYDFASGVDGASRTPIAIQQTYRGGANPNQIYALNISGLLPTDTVQDVIDAYNPA